MVNYSISPMPIRLQKDTNGNINYNSNSEIVKYYAKAQAAGKMTFEQFAEHVASHDSKYHKGDTLTVIVEAAFYRSVMITQKVLNISFKS